ncbi:MAG: type II toxin-antitoxin system RelB/DinJ family antitoxin [Candidatus Sungbacteria bacterium]|nr:type II toxin-antitoxin system RelB/DinJ family antitoxin [Candidatus Sungbacteria bacterium]
MKTLISIKTDVEVKRGIQRIAEEIGIPLSTIINAYFKRLLRERRVDFVLPLIPNKKTAKLLRQAHEDYKRGVNISPLFENADDAIAYLEGKS